MKWTVVWKIEVEEQLASMWMQTADKKAFSEAVNAIEKRLSKNPLELVSREGVSDASCLSIHSAFCTKPSQMTAS